MLVHTPAASCVPVRVRVACVLVLLTRGVLGDLELPLVHGLDRLSAGNCATVLFAEVREPLERLSGQLSLGTRPRWHSLKVF
jgi:hypothetical protein